MLDADVEVDRRNFTVRAALSVAPGERLALFGPSGAGKTTILETIAGLIKPRRGTVALGGRTLTATAPPPSVVPPWRRRIGLLRQDPGLFPHLPVRRNLSYARDVDPGGPEVTEVAAALGIGGLLSAMPAGLSGGQAHRVALGRLLLAPCEALLLDEPYTGLDAPLRRTLTDLVITLVTERSIPAMLVAHELAEAQAFADRLAVLDQGRLLQVGAPAEVVRQPASRRVAEMVGYGGFVALTECAGAAQDLPGAIAGIHPDRVAEGDQPTRGLVLTGKVSAVRPAGARWEVDLALPSATLTCRLAERVPAGAALVVTALDPPVFGPDGAAVSRCDVPPGQRVTRGVGSDDRR